MAAIKHDLEAEAMLAPDHVYSVYIKATPDRVWRAITDGVETERYYYGTRVDSDWSKGGRIVYLYPDGTVAADGEVLDIEPGRFVTMSFHARWSPEIEAEGPVRMIWEIEPPGRRRLEADRHHERPRRRDEDRRGVRRRRSSTSSSGLKTYVETGDVR